jgi:hypothetical protein
VIGSKAPKLLKVTIYFVAMAIWSIKTVHPSTGYIPELMVNGSPNESFYFGFCVTFDNAKEG